MKYVVICNENKKLLTKEEVENYGCFGEGDFSTVCNYAFRCQLNEKNEIKMNLGEIKEENIFEDKD